MVVQYEISRMEANKVRCLDVRSAGRQKMDQNMLDHCTSAKILWHVLLDEPRKDGSRSGSVPNLMNALAH